MEDKLTNTPQILIDLERYEIEAKQVDQLKNSHAYPRVTIHEVNNCLAKINNALWLMAREPDTSTSLFQTCQQIVNKELSEARGMLLKARSH